MASLIVRFIRSIWPLVTDGRMPRLIAVPLLGAWLIPWRARQRCKALRLSCGKSSWRWPCMSSRDTIVRCRNSTSFLFRDCQLGTTWLGRSHPSILCSGSRMPFDDGLHVHPVVGGEHSIRFFDPWSSARICGVVRAEPWIHPSKMHPPHWALRMHHDLWD